MGGADAQHRHLPGFGIDLHFRHLSGEARLRYMLALVARVEVQLRALAAHRFGDGRFERDGLAFA